MTLHGIGIGGFVVVSLYIIIFGYLSNIIGARLAASNNGTLQSFGSAVGAIL